MAKLKKTAVPPSKGTGALWIFLSEAGTSKTFHLIAKRRTSMVKPAERKNVAKKINKYAININKEYILIITYLKLPRLYFLSDPRHQIQIKLQVVQSRQAQAQAFLGFE